MKLIIKKLPCGAVIQQTAREYENITIFKITQESTSFARIFDPNDPDNTYKKSFWSGGLELHIDRKNLPALRQVIDRLIKQDPWKKKK